MTKRNYGVELLRILLMFLIVAGHLLAHTDFRQGVEPYSAKWIFVWGFQAISVCAVDGFVLITGYFSNPERQTLRVKRILLLWGQVLLYSVGIYGILVAFGVVTPSLSGLVQAFLPVLSGHYWFFSSYVLLLILIPFLNRMLRGLNDFSLKLLALVILFVFYLLPIFSILLLQLDPTEGMGIIGFVTLYILGYALRRLEIRLSKWKCAVGLLVNCAVVFASKMVLTEIVERLQLDAGTGLFYHYNTVFQLINAALLLLLFKELSIGEGFGKAVSFVSASVFGVYLLHEHGSVRPLLWNATLLETLRNASVGQSIALSLLIPLGVFAVCLVIDMARRCLGKALARLTLVKRLGEALDAWDAILGKKMADQEDLTFV